MDFYSLSRKELQTLCKKNKIPANMTNLAMADALVALHQVEGLDELFNINPVEADAQQFQEEKVVGTPAPGSDIHHRTASTASTRRKDVNVPVTPAPMPSPSPSPSPSPRSRRRAPATAISIRRKKEAQMVVDGNNGMPTHAPKTPAPPSTRTRAYSTRRSVRLLEKNLSKMTLMDTQDIGLVKIDDVSGDMSNVFRQTHDSASETEKFCDVGLSLQMVSTVISEKTDELQVTSHEKNTEYELCFGSENAVGASFQAEPLEDLRKINSSEAEPDDSNLKLEGSSEIDNDSIEGCDGSDFDLNKPIGKAVHADNESETGLLFELEDSCNSTEPENKKCLGTKQDASFEVSEDKYMEVTNQDVVAFSLHVEVPDYASVDITGQDIVGSLPMSSVCRTDNQGGNDSAKISALSSEVSDDASMEVTTVQGVVALTVEVPDDASMEAADQDIAGSLPMSSVTDDSVSLKGLVACNTDNGNDSAEISAFSVEVSEDASMVATDQDVTALTVKISDDASMDQDIAVSLRISSVCDDSVSLKELVACDTDKQDGNDSTEISNVSLSCNINTLVDGDVIPEEIAIPKQDSSISVETMKHKKSPCTEVPVGNIDEVRLSTMTVAPIYEQKTSDIPIQSIVDQLKGESHCPAQSELKDVVDERIQEEDKNKIYMMKENTSSHELQKLSMGELKKMLKNLTLDGKSNSKCKSNNVAKEVDKKRTALQVLPRNCMTTSETQIDD